RLPGHDKGCKPSLVLPRSRPCHCRDYPPCCLPGLRTSAPSSTDAPPHDCFASSSEPSLPRDDAPSPAGSVPPPSPPTSDPPTTPSGLPDAGPPIWPPTCSAAPSSPSWTRPQATTCSLPSTIPPPP